MTRRTVLSALADLSAVLVFVVLGRTSHDEGTWLGGVAATAGPFLAGALVGWLVLIARRRPPQTVTSGLVVLGSTVVVGMLVRHLVTGRAIPASFVLVATAVLAMLMLGWRAVSSRVDARVQAGADAPAPPR